MSMSAHVFSAGSWSADKDDLAVAASVPSAGSGGDLSDPVEGLVWT